MCANPQSNTIAVRASYILQAISLVKIKKNQGGWSISPRKKAKQKPLCLFEFWGRPFKLAKFIEISEMVCSTTAQYSRGHTLKSRQCSTSVVVMVWFCHATCISNISLRDKTC